MNKKTVILSKVNQSAIIQLNRPQTKNAFTLEMIKNLNQVLNDIKKNLQKDSCTNLIITGIGDTFSSGGDLKLMKKYIDQKKPIEYLNQIVPKVNEVIRSIFTFPLPTLCALNGSAVGGGLNLAFACDFRIAVSNAKFKLGFTDIGLSPATGGSFFPPQLLGISRAMHLSIFGEFFTSKQALEWGLISELSKQENFKNLINKWSDRLNRLNPKIVCAVRQLMYDSNSNNLDAHLDKEFKKIVELGNENEYKLQINLRINK